MNHQSAHVHPAGLASPGVYRGGAGLGLAWPESDRASSARIRGTFDFGWKFLKGDAPGAQQPEFPDSAWRAVDSIEGPFIWKEPAQGSLPTGLECEVQTMNR